MPSCLFDRSGNKTAQVLTLGTIVYIFAARSNIKNEPIMAVAMSFSQCMDLLDTKHLKITRRAEEIPTTQQHLLFCLNTH